MRDVANWGQARLAADSLVAVVDEHVVGFTDVDGRGYIDMMFVSPDLARQGVATALLLEVIAISWTAGTFHLSTHASITARPFFERHGFTVIEERHPVMEEVTMTNYLMRRKLV